MPWVGAQRVRAAAGLHVVMWFVVVVICGTTAWARACGAVGGGCVQWTVGEWWF